MTEDEKSLMINRLQEVLPIIRKRLKLSQSDLGELSGLSRGVISNVECGKQNMTKKTFLALAAVFSVNKNCDKLFEAFDINLEQLNEFFNCKKESEVDNDG